MPASTDARVWTDEAYGIADELRSIASEGLAYAENDYDRHRYDRVLRCAAQLVGLVEERPAESILAGFGADLDLMTPLVGVDAMVMEDGQVLLIQRADSGLWCLPGGAAEVGETLAQAAERELREETGMEGRADGVAGLFDSRLWHSGMKRHMVHVVFRVRKLSGTPAKSREALAAAYFAESELPPLSHGHRDWLPLLLQRRRNDERGAYFDP